MFDVGTPGHIEQSVKELEIEAAERKHAEEKLRESEEKLAGIIASIADHITMIDDEYNIVWANDVAKKMFGPDLVGKKCYEAYRGYEKPCRSCIVRNCFEDGKAHEYEAVVPGPDGKEMTFWSVTSVAARHEDGRPKLVVEISRDITKRKQIEEGLRKVNKELKSFIRVISHDLKTPVISIQGLASRLLKKYPEKLGERGCKYLEQINASIHRIEILVSDLFSLSRSGRVASTFEDVPFLKIVKEVSSALQDRIEGKGIELIVEPNLPRIYCDRRRIYQALENLLVNAIKYMGNIENPRIEIGCKDLGGLCQFYVRDNGIGIDPKYHRKIFEMFHRLKEIKDEEGTGLGLAIVERIISDHGGKVWVESEKEKGATFYFTLPKDPNAA